MSTWPGVSHSHRLQGLPRYYARFQEYLRTDMNPEGTGPELVPLLPR
jgi:hypothetical protein